jgi:prevent-host-death family protein
MRRVKIAELKDHLSEHLRAVERGDVVIVTDRDRPIARIVPMESDGVRLLPPSRDLGQLRRRRYPRQAWAIGSSDLLAEERRERR